MKWKKKLVTLIGGCEGENVNRKFVASLMIILVIAYGVMGHWTKTEWETFGWAMIAVFIIATLSLVNLFHEEKEE